MGQTLFMILCHVRCNYSKIPSNIGHRNSWVDQVRKKDKCFYFYLVLYLQRSGCKLKHLSHKSLESTKHLLIHCGISKNNSCSFFPNYLERHIKQSGYKEGPLGHRCGADTSIAGRGQGYEETNDCQMTSSKCNKINKWNIT